VALKDLLSVFDAEARKKKSFERLVTRLLSKNHQHEDRMAAIEQLAAMDSKEATSALFRRWDMMADKAREDQAEKEYLLDVLVGMGPKMLDALREHNDRSPNVTWPIQVLRKVATEEDVVTELLRVLGREQARLASWKPEKKARLLQLLSDHEDARIEAAALLSLHDFDEHVRFEAVQLLQKRGGDTAAAPLVDRLLHRDEDSARVREAILRALAARGWSVAERKDSVQALLGSAWKIAASGMLVATGAAPPPAAEEIGVDA
jgi:hypothetical protein